MKTFFLVAWIFLFSLTFNAQDKMPESQWATLDKARIHYYDIGSKKNKTAIVFVHGWACNADFWKNSLNAFPQNRVIALDLIGHGQSDRPNAIYSMDLFAKSVDAVLTKAKVEKAILVGHSMGTPVARQFYRLYPNKTAAIVIVDGALRPYMSKSEFDQFMAPLRSSYVQNAGKFINGMTQPISDGTLKTWIGEQMMMTRATVALSAMDAMNDQTIWSNDKINVPVLAVMAESATWPADTEEFYKTIAPDLSFKMWKNVSHFLMMEKPAEFNGEVKAFISQKALL